MKREELVSVLEIVKPGLARNDEIEQAKSFVFKDGHVITYNDSISIRHPLDVGIEGVVDADAFYKLLSRVKSEQIKLKVIGNEIRVQSWKSEVTTKFKAGFILIDDITLPIDEIGDIGDWKKLSEQFNAAIRFASFSCANNMNRPALTCIYVGKDGVIKSSDSKRVTTFQMCKMPTESFLLPVSSARELIKNTFAEISLGKGWVHFRNVSGTVFSCRTYGADKYPNVDQVFTSFGTEVSFPSESPDILNQAMAFTGSVKELEDEEINVTFSHKKVRFYAKQEGAWFDSRTKCDYTGDELTFTINPNFLKDMLELKTPDDKSQLQSIKVGNNVNGVGCIIFEGTNWKHFAMLKVCGK